MIIIITDRDCLGPGQLTTIVLNFDGECMGHGQLTLVVVLIGILSYKLN